MEKHDFCFECNKNVEYTVRTEKEELTIKGVSFSFDESRAYCKICGNELDVPELDDINYAARENAYRYAANLISEKEIKDICTKYDIGAGPLANILELGEVTINRYVGGATPSKKNSDLLYEVKDSYKRMEYYLKKNKDNIRSVAYIKCKDAIEYIKSILGKEKIDIIARFFYVSNRQDVTNMSIQKMLYYAQGFFKAIYGKDLFNDDCQAWVYGPVYPKIYEKYRNIQNLESLSVSELNTGVDTLSKEELSFLKEIFNAFGIYSGYALRDMTHKEDPWKNTRIGLPAEARSERIIKKEDMENYFKKVVEEYDIKNPSDIKKYSKKMLEKVMQ